MIDTYEEDGLADDLAVLLRNPQSQRFLWWILQQCGIYRASYTEGRGVSELLEGKRSLGLMLIAKMELVSPVAFQRLSLEMAEAELKEREAAARAGADNV